MRNKALIITAALILISVLAGICFAYELYSIGFPKDEVVVFENHMANGKTAKVISTYYKQKKDYVIKQVEENGNVIKTVVNKYFIPKVYKKTSKKGKILEYASYGSGKLKVSIPGKRVDKSVKIPSTYYDTYTLFYALRKFPFGKKDKINLNVAYHDPGNIRAVEMEIKNKGTETVNIDSGTFKCYKLEMRAKKAVERAIWPYKYYFWFTTDSKHHFVKFQGRERDASIITSELAIYKVGGKYIVKKASKTNTASTR
jgi:hypothetical protein